MIDRDMVQCYRAEDVVFEGLLLSERQSYQSLVAQTREIERTSEWRSVCSTEVTIGRASGGRSFAHPWAAGIAYGSAADRSTVMHEMAHVATPGDRHGPAWRMRFVWLTEIAYGREWAQALLHAFATSRLAVDPVPYVLNQPLFPPHLFEAQHGAPLFTDTTTPTRAIAL